MRRACILLALGVTLAFSASPAAAADDKQQCLNASDQGQSLRDDGKYRKAREAFATCARDSCPAIVRRDCMKWLAELEQSSPSIVVGAKDDKGADLVEVTVTVDGSPLQSRLDGKPVLVDPGEHTFHFETPGHAAVEQRVVVRAGEKSRLIAVQFGNPPPPPGTPAPLAPTPTPAPAPRPAPGPEDESGHSPQAARASAWVFGGIAVVAFGTEAYFGISGLSSRGNLEKTCGPTSSCSQASVNSVRTKFTVADIALGVGVVSTAISAYLFLAAPKEPTSSHATAVDVTPVPGGAAMSVAGRF
jgi:hypothetical protein